MKRMIRIFVPVLVLALCLVPFAGCGGGSQPEAPAAPAADGGTAPAADSGTAPAEGGTLNIWSFTDEVPTMLEKFKELNPDFNYDLNITIIATTEGAYQPALDQALMSGGSDAPDLYVAEEAFVVKYTQGDAAHFAAPYADLGIDIPGAVDAAQIATYAREIGTRGDGAIVALPYQATGGALIYRRSIAQDVWGTDDPATIKNNVGPGIDKFMAAAEEVKAKGYAMISGQNDLFHPMKSNASSGWIVDGKLNIDPGREAFLDAARTVWENEYSNRTSAWQDPWFADMSDAGPRKVFCFFGPAWLINYVMAGNAGDTFGDWAVCEAPIGFSWGGSYIIANNNSQHKAALGEIVNWITLDTSDNGLQYMWANGTLYGEGGTKDTVASGVVMGRSDGSVDFLGGQNMFDVFVPAGVNAKGDIMTQFDETINTIYQDMAAQYAQGIMSRDETLAAFKTRISDELGIAID